MSALTVYPDTQPQLPGMVAGTAPDSPRHSLHPWRSEVSQSVGNRCDKLGETITDFTVIQARLNAIGVQFERWTANRDKLADADQDNVLAAYSDSIDRLKQQYDFQSVDVISLSPDHPEKAAFRQKFLAEHIHADFEVRFFIEGRGLFYLHVADKVYAVLCEQGDLISVPANTTHWFDMGENPQFKCIRLFTTPDGWVADFTGSDISASFPTIDQYIAGLS